MFVLGVIGAIAICAGYLLPLSSGPLPAFHMEWVAAIGWCLLASAYFTSAQVVFSTFRRVALLLMVPGLLAGATLIDFAVGRGSYWGVGVVRLLYLIAALIASWFGWEAATALQQDELAARRAATAAFALLLLALIGAAATNALIGIAQYINIDLPRWVSLDFDSGARVFGNLRQANLYALLMVLGTVAVAAAVQFRLMDGYLPQRLQALAATTLLVLLGCGAALSLSRTGAVMLWAVSAAAYLGRGLNREVRGLLLVPVAAHTATWAICTWLDAAGSHTYAVAASVQVLPGGGNFSSFRSEIWSGMLLMLREHPLLGFGAGNVGFAYFLMDLPVRVHLNMQYAHNLLLQVALEHGLPFALLWCAILAALLLKARRAWIVPAGRLCGMALVAFAIHSNLEYPLYFTYFLLPCAFVLGCSVSFGAAVSKAPAGRSIASGRVWAGVLAGILLVAGVGLDYQRILPTFHKASREEAMRNLERGYKTWLFTYWMDYAVIANVAVTPANAVTFHKLSTRLSRVVIQPFTVTNLALSAAMLRKTDEAAFYLGRLREMSPSAMDELWVTLTPDEQQALALARQKMETGSRVR